MNESKKRAPRNVSYYFIHNKQKKTTVEVIVKLQ